MPLCMESYGAVGNDFIKFIKHIAHETANNGVLIEQNISLPLYQRQLYEELAIALQIGNGILACNHGRDATYKLPRA